MISTISEAKKEGLVDNIETIEIKLKIITLFHENNNYIPLTRIPSYYFVRFKRALVYMGKLVSIILTLFFFLMMLTLCMIFVRNT